MPIADLPAYRDPDHDANSSRYHTGRPCIERGCDEPAGTAWGPHWCFRHNAERMARIDAAFERFDDFFTARGGTAR